MAHDTPAFDPTFQIIPARYQVLFNADYYLQNYPSAASTTLSSTEESFYRENYQSIASTDLNLFHHYMTIGWRDGNDPSNLFDTSAYLAANSDVAASGENPLDHYINVGMAEYRGFGGTVDPETGLIFDIGVGVPVNEVDQVKNGLIVAHNYLETNFGGDIPPDVRSHIIVKLEATGEGNQEFGAGGSVATGWSAQNDLLPRPYFDVAHEQYRQDTTFRGWTSDADVLKTVIHEYVHGWTWFGGQSIWQQPLGNWINEGIAQYIAHEAVIDAGQMSRADVLKFEYNVALSDGEFSYALVDLVGPPSPVWPGHVGHLAIDALVRASPNGQMSLRILMEELAATNSVHSAFKAAFNMELEDFYQQFEEWRADVLQDPDNAFDAQLGLILIEGPIDWQTQPENIELVASTYQFFTGGIPGAEGFEFLISSPANNGDLNDPYYEQFNQENTFINFANNLGSLGEGADEFALDFGNLTFAETIETAFEEIIGSQAIINSGGNPQASIDFFLGAFDFYAAVAEERVVPGGVNFDQAVKVVAIGSILNEAFKADLGRYPDAVVEVTDDIELAGTTDLFGLDLFA